MLLSGFPCNGHFLKESGAGPARGPHPQALSTLARGVLSVLEFHQFLSYFLEIPVTFLRASRPQAAPEAMSVRGVI